MKNSNKLFIPLLFSFTTICAQEININDSIAQLNEVLIESFQRKKSLLETNSTVHVISNKLLNINHPERLVESINLIPGAKMDERSPASYRLSMRGSTIRSPFGVRNVKIYYDNFILTDATGNTYLNLIEPQFLSSIELMKGPQGGEYGMETGGTVVLKNQTHEGLETQIGLGNYEMWNEKIFYAKQHNNHQIQFGQSYYSSENYRDQSAVKKLVFMVNDKWKYNATNQFKFNLFYTNLHYETPGGLTTLQMLENPRQARLATAALPSAVEQQNGIFNKTVFGGIAHLWKINSKWNQFTLIQGSYTDFKNPFISNYEKRKERNWQGKLYFNYESKQSISNWETRFGLETGTNSTAFRNYDNLKGKIGDPQKFDDIKTFSTYYYINQSYQYRHRFNLDASINLHQMNYHWHTRFPLQEKGAITFDLEWNPQLSLNYQFSPTFSIRGKIVRGLSTPTTEEVRSSNQIIQKDIEAEFGWNKEIGIRKQWKILYMELTAFNYHLKNAIVKRLDVNGNDYYINAGGTKQQGIEISIESKNISLPNNFLHAISFYLSSTFYDFKYHNYQIGKLSYDGFKIPGIAKWNIQSLISIDVLQRFSIQYSNYFTSSFFLDDANTVKENGYTIGNVKLEGNFGKEKIAWSIWVGIQNLYNTTYSAGYDFNAFGNRFYNPAAERNYYFGIRFKY